MMTQLMRSVVVAVVRMTSAHLKINFSISSANFGISNFSKITFDVGGGGAGNSNGIRPEAGPIGGLLSGGALDDFCSCTGPSGVKRPLTWPEAVGFSGDPPLSVSEQLRMGLRMGG